ncbi:hemerythrin domain-containing protein [Marmoricola sp. RAF53]|uniref:hemerythrin domain-containing protein n=1 Tax=Marmoricola sp. RAF53 TaxID=3233059 RepID=UPI003F9809B2
MDVRKTVVQMLADQHTHLRKLLEEVADTAGARRRRAFDELGRFLVAHETAEEVVTHPVARDVNRDLVGGRLEEEHELKEALADLEELGTDHAGFDHRFAAFRARVLDHIEAEEEFEFPLLVQGLTVEEQVRAAEALRAIEDVAPTHPHPAAGESAVGNLAASSASTLADMVRDVAGAVLRR